MSSVRISLIIPAYNEARYLAPCLEAIAQQTVKPHEVIVVDNNSSDATAAIAARYPFVRVLREPRQGVVFARNCGLDAATGTILARIDADAILPPTWLEVLQKAAQAHPRAGAYTGRGVYYDMPWPRLIGWAQVFFFQALQLPAMHGATLYGASMALRRSSWEAVREQCHTGSNLDEDIDLTLQLRKRGITTRYVPTLWSSMSLRRDKTDPVSVARYISTWPRNYAVNGYIVSAAYIAVLTGLVLGLSTLSWLVVSPFVKLGATVQPDKAVRR